MKWMRLKLYLIPSIMQEVDLITEIYLNLINEIPKKRTDESINQLLELRESISKRVDEIDNFYEDNIGDSKVLHFEKARIRLKKLLMYDPDAMNRMDTENYQFRGLTYNDVDKNEKQYFIKPNVGTSNNKIVKTLSKDNKVILSEKISSLNYKQKSDKNNSESKPTSPKKYKTSAKKTKISDKNIEINLDLTDSNNNNINMQSFSNTISKNLSNTPSLLMDYNFENLGNCKEIVFKLKLTEQEYKLLLREKSKILLK